MSRFHPNTDLLIDYWRRKAGVEALPARADIGPGDFLGLLAQVLMVGREARGHYPVRLAGGFIDDLHGERVKGRNVLLLWAMDDRTRLQTALELSRRNPHPIIAVAEATAKGIEMIARAIAAPGGDEAISLRVAEQYVAAFEKLAKHSTTVLLPANAHDTGAMVAQALTVFDQIKSRSIEAKSPWKNADAR